MTTSRRYWIRNLAKAWEIQRERERRMFNRPRNQRNTVLVETRKNGIFVGGRYCIKMPADCRAWFSVSYHNGRIFPSGICFVINR